MLAAILTIIFLPIIVFLPIAASHILLLVGAFAIIMITFLWGWQLASIVVVLLLIVGCIVKMIKKKK